MWCLSCSETHPGGTRQREFAGFPGGEGRGCIAERSGSNPNLVEENLSPAPLPEGRPPTSKEATKGLTSGPFEGAGDVKKEDASGSDYSEGDEEEIKATKGAGEAEDYEEESAEEESEEPRQG